MKDDPDEKDGYFQNAFSRNIGLLTESEQKRLQRARIAIPGMGGVGGIHLITMARSGIGKFNISDFDIFEPVNANRQFGANVSTYGRSKLDVMKEQALLINPYLEINTFPDGIHAGNMDQFLEDVDVVLDGLDFFNFDIRRQLFKKARDKGVYVITAGPMGFSSAMLIFAPDRGMTFDEYFNITENMQSEDKYLSFALGLAPKPTHIQYMDFSRVSFESKAGPSLNVSCQLCAGMAGIEALRILLQKKGLRPVPYYVQFDPYLMKLKKGKLYFGNKNPIQRIKMAVVKRLLESNKGIPKEIQPQAPEPCFSESGILTNEALRFLVSAGIQAPSGDNAQPWKFIAQGNKLSVLVDPEADRSFFNVNQIASMISCGAVIENIKIACSQLGIKPDIDYFSNNTAVGGSLFFHSTRTRKDSLSEWIWKRYTNRTLFQKTPMESRAIDGGKNAVLSIPGARLRCVTQRESLKKLARIIYQIDRIRTEHRALHEHLNQMIRFDLKDVYSTNDGLPLKNLQAGWSGEQFLKFSKPWPVMNFLNKAGIGRMVALHSYQGIINSSAVMLLTVDGMADKNFMEGGRALQRIWLDLTRRGYQVQPMTAITLFYMRLALNKESGFLPKHNRLLNAVKNDYLNLFPGLSDSMAQIMLFRVGKGREIRHFTRRKKMEDFLVQL